MTVNASRQFVESFHGGNAAAAITAIAAAHGLTVTLQPTIGADTDGTGPARDLILATAAEHGIAVAMQDREDFEFTLGREMTDEEFASLKPRLDGYAEFLGTSGAAPSIEEWRYQVLTGMGLLTDED